ncbi:MAG: CapA family protein [Anaerolineae bacterium]|nr:CapA family protein [Anaerolineae bacterium]
MEYRKIAILVLALLSLAMGSLSVAQATCTETTGTVSRQTYTSGLLGQTMYYTVYTPPCYDANPDATYPALYLMHGSNDDDGHWVRLGMVDLLDAGIQSGELPPMLVVLPFGNVIANRNRFDAISWGNIFMTELFPTVENLYRTDDRRAIGGISRGGFWAYQIALKHPDLFPTVGGHSAFFDLYHAPPEENPLHLIESVNITNMRFWLDRGKDDFAYEGLDIMGERMSEQNANYQYIIQPEGQHNNAYWSQYVGDYLAFYAADWLEVPSQPTLTVSAANAFATNTPTVPLAATAEPTLVATPTLAPLPTESAEAQSTWDVFFPVVAFPSLRTSVSSDWVAQVASSEFIPELILDTDTLAQMQAAGMAISGDTRTVLPDELYGALWRDYNAITLLPMSRIQTDMRILWLDDVPVVDQLDRYVLAVPAIEGNFNPAALYRLTLSGVTALTRQTTTALDDNGIEWAASGIQDYVQRSDTFHTSNEVSIYPTCPQTSEPTLGGPTSFCSKPEHFGLLPLLDVDLVELSGNHNNDYGYDAYIDTYDFYQENDIATVGGGLTLDEARQPWISADGVVGVLTCNMPGPYYALVNEDASLLGGVRPGAAPCDWDWLSQSVPQLSQQVGTVVVTIQHFEIEDYLPSNEQRIDFRRLADLGADVVVNTAAHKPQIFEFYSTQRGDRAVLHYGLGNLFFDQPFWGNSRFFMDTLYIYENRFIGVELFPGLIDDLARPHLMTPDEREQFLFFMLRQQNGF